MENEQSMGMALAALLPREGAFVIRTLRQAVGFDEARDLAQPGRHKESPP